MAKPERKRALRGRAGRMKGGRGSGRASTGQVRLWGHHAVEAALMNPARRHHKLWATREAIAELDGELPQDFAVEYAAPSDLDRLVSRDAPHQGLVLECAALEDRDLADIIADADANRPIVLLDQVTDPHNVGAILRSAAAFGAAAIVTQDRHAPPESGVSKEEREVMYKEEKAIWIKKLVKEDVLRVQIAPATIRHDLDSKLHRVWNQGRIRVGDLWDYYTKYPYLPRLRDKSVLMRAIEDAAKEPGPFLIEAML